MVRRIVQGGAQQTESKRGPQDRLQEYGRLIRRVVPMAGYTTFGIGGPAQLLAEVSAVEDLAGLVTAARADGIPVTVLGEGSNVLVSDDGVDGLVVVNRCQGIRREGNQITAEAGARLHDVIDLAIGAGLGGMETMIGIPGTVGGAVVGNAGAYGQSISDVLESAKLLREDGQIITQRREGLGFAYRTSRLKQSHDVVLSAEFVLTPGAREALRRSADAIIARRKSKLPLWNDCAGSYFKNIEDSRVPNGKIPAGKLLEEAQAKSFRMGRAAVSEHHANVIVNLGGATAAEVLALAEQMKHAVLVKFGVELEEEVRFLGRVG